MPGRYPATVTALAALMSAQPALADVSALDVWNNGAALFEALGGEQQGELVRDGNRVTVVDHIVTFDLPMGAGKVSIALSSYEMVEENGAVAIVYPDGMGIALDASITGEGDISATLELQGMAITTQATGDPGAISYLTEAGPSSVVLTDLDLPGELSSTATFQVDFTSYVTETRIIEDVLLVIYSRSEIGRSTSRSEFDDGFGFTTTTISENGPSVGTINMGLIPGGADILNLSAALRDGMYLSAESYGESIMSETVSLLDGEIFQDQHYEAVNVTGRFLLDSSQLALGAEIGSGFLEFQQQFMTPPAFGIDWHGVSFDLAGPILRSDEPQPFRIGLGLDDLRLGPTIWALFDPEKVLPRDPGSLEIETRGRLTLDADLPNFLALPELGGRQEASVQVTEIEIERFGVSALGVTADSTGSFGLDYEGYSVFPGVPWPEGAGQAEIRGLNGLIDALIDKGLIGSEEALGLRLMISLGTIVSGDDILTSEIEFTEDGRIIANGQPINLP